MPYLNPHSFRDALARLGETRCQTPEDFKAWSQNLGHEKVLTTFFSYGAVPASRQREIIRGLVRSLDTVSSEDKIAAAVVRRMREEETRA